MLADRILQIGPSKILHFNQLAKKMEQQGFDVISLAAGEPDLPPPQSAIQALEQSSSDPQTWGYSHAQGELALRQTLSTWLKQYDLSFDPEAILITSGCKMGLFQSFMTLLNKGDQVLIGAPYWASYPAMIELCGAYSLAVPTDCSSRYLMIADHIRQYAGPQTKAILLCSPHNPTGQYYTKEELLDLAQALRDRPHMAIICDDIYAQLTSQPIPHLLQVAPDLASRTLVINGLAKSGSVPGWRIGFVAGPKEWIAAMTALQSQIATCVAVPMQHVAKMVYADPDFAGYIKTNAAIYRQRAQEFIALLSQSSQMDCLRMDAGFYVWVDITRLLQEGRWQTDRAFSEELLEKAYVAGIGGYAFGVKGYMRFSMTQSLDRIREAAHRILQFVSS